MRNSITLQSVKYSSSRFGSITQSLSETRSVVVSFVCSCMLLLLCGGGGGAQMLGVSNEKEKPTSTSADPEGGQGVRTPPGKSWTPPPLENVGPPLEP